MAEPWRLHFFQRHAADDPTTSVPAIEFLDTLPSRVAAEIDAVLDAVAKAPPPSFSGGGKWEAMHDDMAGFFEVRVQGPPAASLPLVLPPRARWRRRRSRRVQPGAHRRQDEGVHDGALEGRLRRRFGRS